MNLVYGSKKALRKSHPKLLCTDSFKHLLESVEISPFFETDFSLSTWVILLLKYVTFYVKNVL